MDTRELDQVHSKLDRLDEKLDNIVELIGGLRVAHGERITSLESFAGFIKVGGSLVIPILIKVIYDIAKTL